MKRKWIVVFLAVLTIVVWGAVRARLVHAAWRLVVPLALAIVLAASRVVSVTENTALVIRSSLHSAVRRVVPGPAVTFLIPLLEKASSVIDTRMQLERVVVENALQADRLPTTLCFVVHVAYRLAPDLVPRCRLGVILPEMMADHSKLVELGSDYCLRNLLTESDLSHLYNGRLGRLERHLEQALMVHMQQVGIEVKKVHLIVYPPVGLYHVITNAEQEQVGIKIQEEKLVTLLRALANRPQAAESLAQLELARSFGQNGQMWVTLDPSALKSNDILSHGTPTMETQLSFPPDVYPGLS